MSDIALFMMKSERRGPRTLADHLVLHLRSDGDGTVVQERFNSLKSAAQRGLKKGGDYRHLAENGIFLRSTDHQGRAPVWWEDLATEWASDKESANFRCNALATTYDQIALNDLSPEGQRALELWAGGRGTGRIAQLGSETNSQLAIELRYTLRQLAAEKKARERAEERYERLVSKLVARLPSPDREDSDGE